MQGIVALILDTGILGSLFLFTLLVLNIVNHLRSKDNLTNKLFNLSMITIVLLCLFIGYSLVNIAYVLFMLPDGITYIKNNKLDSKFFKLYSFKVMFNQSQNIIYLTIF